MVLIYSSHVDGSQLGAALFRNTISGTPVRIFFCCGSGCCLRFCSAAYAWCRWGAGQWGFSPLIQLGQTSLLVYWVHIEFVYGRVSILHKRANSIPMASLGLLTIFLAMLALSTERRSGSLEDFRRPRCARSPGGQRSNFTTCIDAGHFRTVAIRFAIVDEQSAHHGRTRIRNK